MWSGWARISCCGSLSSWLLPRIVVVTEDRCRDMVRLSASPLARVQYGRRLADKTGLVIV